MDIRVIKMCVQARLKMLSTFSRLNLECYFINLINRKKNVFETIKSSRQLKQGRMVSDLLIRH